MAPIARLICPNSRNALLPSEASTSSSSDSVALSSQSACLGRHSSSLIVMVRCVISLSLATRRRRVVSISVMAFIERNGVLLFRMLKGCRTMSAHRHRRHLFFVFRPCFELRTLAQLVFAWPAGSIPSRVSDHSEATTVTANNSLMHVACQKDSDQSDFVADSEKLGRTRTTVATACGEKSAMKNIFQPGGKSFVGASLPCW